MKPDSSRGANDELRTAYFDCFAGASGDMIVGALIDLGVDVRLLQAELAKLKITGWRMQVRTVQKLGVTATKVDVLLEQGLAGDTHADGGFREVYPSEHAGHVHDHDHDGHHHHAGPHHHHHDGPIHGHHEHRPLKEILGLLEASDLDPVDRDRAARIFRRLGEAEAKVHGVPVDEIHFHEVGSIDAIVDIVSACVALRILGIDKIVVSPIHLGSGFVRMAHGLYPVPGPATTNLLVGAPVYATQVQGELVTPTGAAILTTLADGFGPIPPMVIHSTGYGAGAKDREIPNVLRVVLGDSAGARSNYVSESAVVVEANIDDLNPEIYEYVMERMFEAGAMDVYLTPIQMKKNRPAQMLQVLAVPSSLQQLLNVLFTETTTIGVRTYEVVKYMLDREVRTVATEYGPLRVKIARSAAGVLNVAPEYDDCKAAARAHGVPLKFIYQAAVSASSAQKSGR